MADELSPAEADWQQKLTDDQYRVNRTGGTEPPFDNPLWNEKRAGTYYDVTGEQPLFRSEDKYDSGTGWPSFTKPISDAAVTTQTEPDGRTEVLSSEHGHHLGHVFPDGPGPEGMRYCMNSASLKFVPDEEQA